MTTALVDLHYAASLGEEYYSKITASLGPVFDKINKTSAKDIFFVGRGDGFARHPTRKR